MPLPKGSAGLRLPVMKILMIGNGGREHALLWKLRQDSPDAQFYITHGNGGTAGLASPLPLDPTDIPALAEWAEKERIDLSIVGPEAPLAMGIADAFSHRGLALFGPSAAATAIESSKAYAKDLMRRAGVPTAAFGIFSDAGEAGAFVREQGAPIVVKASGLASGKGAIVCETEAQALEAIDDMLERRAFGDAGREVVIEEFMHGEELSVFAMTDGEDVLTLLPSQDHKRVGEGDTGLNTGGMGAYAPVSFADEALLRQVREEILRPTLSALRADGRTFRGLLYAGLMLTAEGPKVVEFNARFGDPETQAILPLLRSSLLEPMLAVARGESIASSQLEWSGEAGLTTILAADGYPGDFAQGNEIAIPAWVEDADDLFLFHGRTRREDGRLLTAGGRVLAVTAVAPSIAEAAERSRAAAAAIEFDDRYFRRDIGWRELERHAGAA